MDIEANIDTNELETSLQSYSRKSNVVNDNRRSDSATTAPLSEEDDIENQAKSGSNDKVKNTSKLVEQLLGDKSLDEELKTNIKSAKEYFDEQTQVN